MAMVIITYDLPLQEQMAAYIEKGRSEWIPTVVRQPGVKEFRAMRNAFHATPRVMTMTECDSLTSALQFIASEDYARVIEGLRSVGCNHISVQLWDISPIVPEPIRSTGG